MLLPCHIHIGKSSSDLPFSNKFTLELSTYRDMSTIQPETRHDMRSTWPPNQVAVRDRHALPPSIRARPGQDFDLRNEQPPHLDRQPRVAADHLVFGDNYESDIVSISTSASVNIIHGTIEEVQPCDRGSVSLPMQMLSRQASMSERSSLLLQSVGVGLFSDTEIGRVNEMSTYHRHDSEVVAGEDGDQDTTAATNGKRTWAKRVSSTVQDIGRKLKRKVSLWSGPDSAVEVIGYDHRSSIQKTSQSSSPEPRMGSGESDCGSEDRPETRLSALTREPNANGEYPIRRSLSNEKCNLPLFLYRSSHRSNSSKTTLAIDSEVDRDEGAPLERFNTMFGAQTALSDRSGSAKSFRSFDKNLTGDPKQVIEADRPALAMEERSELIAQHIRRKTGEGVFFEEKIERVFSTADGNNTTEAERWRASNCLVEENLIIEKMSRQEFEDAVRARALGCHTRFGRLKYRMKHLKHPWRRSRSEPGGKGV